MKRTFSTALLFFSCSISLLAATQPDTGPFDAVLAGRMTPEKLGVTLKKLAPQGTTEGSLFVASDYLKLPILQ